MATGTLYDNVIDIHTVAILPNGKRQLVVGRHPGHEVTSNPASFERLRDEGLKVAHPELSFFVRDHIVRTACDKRPYDNSDDELMAQTLDQNVKDFGVNYFRLGSGNGGVCHVVFPEQGIIWPGMVAVCGDSHTSTYGALGAIGFGVGSTQVGHVLATQSFAIDEKLKVRRINFNGRLREGVTAKDMIIYAIQQMGAKAGNGFAHEFGGEVVENLGIEGRLTLCNMGVEGGAKVAYVNPDNKVYAYLKGRPFAPRREFDKLVNYAESIKSKKDAVYDDTVNLDVSGLEPMITWGTSPDQAIPISGKIPSLSSLGGDMRKATEKTLSYMGLEQGKPMLGTPVDVVFIGSCTNGRLSDLEAAASILKDRKVAVKTIIVPGSEEVKYWAEVSRLPDIFKSAGAEWREYPGCSMCLSMSPDRLMHKERCASTSNRPFKDRQGEGAKTHLVSPYTAAATAIEGKIADPRRYLV